ncbi:MAG: hypothetical protein IPH26_17990 [Sterolibacteriaceae bacterium]|uniref:Uncharacterized protein n=1 Tax=Candidatus Methylophosphatis roskildensis TaxID=2899263 RepID=A0A9D7HVM6_9PROT|nr:hypothetical protein [Candidatus Methylophosphatis roskildensis]
MIPSHFGRAGDLLDWLEGEFLPRMLRLLHSLASRRVHEIEPRTLTQ